MTTQHPILWSFRRCPYAIRARLAINAAGVPVELREILLRDKPGAFLAASPSATVPCLELPDQVLDESLDIMVWVLKQRDPQGWLQMPDDGWALITENDGPFKAALDHVKYAVRFPEVDPQAERAKAAEHLCALDARLRGQDWLFGASATLADFALLPFVRQFANVDRAWFDAQGWPDVSGWLDRFLQSAEFADVMTKYPPWTDGDAPVPFGAELSAANP